MLHIVRMRQMIDTRQQRAELPPVVDDPAHRNPAKADAIIAALAPDQPGARALTNGALIRERDLERGINRFRSAVGEEYPVQPFGHDRRNPRCQLKRQRMAQLKGRRIIQLGRCFLDRLDNRRAAMAGIDRPQPCRAVKYLPPIIAGIMHVLCGFQLARVSP